MLVWMAAWVIGSSEAIGSVSMAPELVTVIMAVVAGMLAFGAAVIIGEWLQDRAKERRRNAPRKKMARGHRAHWRLVGSHR